MTTRSLTARLGRLEQHIPAQHGPIEYRVLLHDGTPVFPRPGEDPSVPLPSSPGVGEEIVYRIASWEESELSKAWDEPPITAGARRPARVASRSGKLRP
jgi:hypothetical protein